MFGVVRVSVSLLGKFSGVSRVVWPLASESLYAEPPSLKLGQTVVPSCWLSVSLTWERRVVRLPVAIESLLADVSTPRSSAWTAI